MVMLHLLEEQIARHLIDITAKISADGLEISQSAAVQLLHRTLIKAGKVPQNYTITNAREVIENLQDRGVIKFEGGRFLPAGDPPPSS